VPVMLRAGCRRGRIITIEDEREQLETVSRQSARATIAEMDWIASRQGRHRLPP
jgi:hypothetical protein